MDLVLVMSSLSCSQTTLSRGTATVRVALVLCLIALLLRPLLTASAELLAGGVAVLCVVAHSLC